MRVLVTGAAGLLGAAILREFQGVSDLLAWDRSHLDVADDAAVSHAIRQASPDLVINCAAYNDVDGAERHPDLALKVNAFGALALAKASREVNARFVHYSTDFVFDGEADRPYIETDAPRPRSFYAASKLLGDWFALESPDAYVLRVESLFGIPGVGGARRGSLGTIVDRIRAGEEVPVFVDRTVSPSYTADVAAATRALVDGSRPGGLYNCVNTGAVSWADIAAEAARLLDRPLRMAPLTLESARLAAVRPRYSALSTARLASAGVNMPSWQDALARFLAAG